jgi:hypothetical protein
MNTSQTYWYERSDRAAIRKLQRYTKSRGTECFGPMHCYGTGGPDQRSLVISRYGRGFSVVTRLSVRRCALTQITIFDGNCSFKHRFALEMLQTEFEAQMPFVFQLAHDHDMADESDSACRLMELQVSQPSKRDHVEHYAITQGCLQYVKRIVGGSRGGTPVTFQGFLGRTSANGYRNALTTE